MSEDWLATSSFEQVYDVIGAVDTLSINSKLILANTQDRIEDAEVEEAKNKLLAFLGRLEIVVNSVANNRNGPILGTDPRMGELVTRFLAQQGVGARGTSLYSTPLAELSSLVKSTQLEDLPVLISHLHELRLLLKQHVQADTNRLLGDL